MSLPEPKYQNSAGRLLALIGNLPPNQAIVDMLPKYFGQSPQSQQEKQQATLANLMEIHKLYLDFRQDMLDAEISDDQRNVLLTGLSSIGQSIYPMQLNNVFRAITDAEKSLLEVCATIIPQEGALTKNDIYTIRKSIASLRSSVEDSKISPTLRKTLLELIRLSEDAISRFNIYGARGLKKAFKSMLAEAAEVYAMTSDSVNQEELKKSPVWKSIVGHLKTFDAVASRLLKYKPMLENAVRLLLGGPPS